MIRKINLLLPVFVVAMVLAFSSCKEPNTIGLDVQPDLNLVNVYYTDTLTLDVTTVREDSLQSDEAAATFNLLGSYTDPIFGLSRASFYAQMHLPNNNTNFSFGTNPVLDSVVLTLAYADYYGDTLTPQNVMVYRVTDDMYKDSVYHSNDSFTTSDLLFSGQVDVHPKDSVDLGGVTKAPHLRLKLDNTFGASFLDPANASSLLDNTSFVNFFKGIYVKTDDITGTGTGCIMSFNLIASMSKMSFYYSNDGADSLEADFEINTECSRLNHFEHDYTNSSFGNNFPIAGNNQVYVQSLSGVKGKIKIPYLMNLIADGDISINKAELVVPVEDNNVYASHQNLFLFGLDSTGKEILIPDLLESASYYGGSFNSTNQNYTFNIARQIQKLLKGTTTDYGLSLIASGGAANAFRTVIPGTGRTDKKIQLRVTYSKLK